MEQKTKPWYGENWILIVGVLFVLIIIGLVAGDHKNDKPSSSATSEIASESHTEPAVATQLNTSNWTYSEDEDEMSGEKRYFASCISSTIVSFDFPYDGGSTFTLTVRNLGRGNDVLIRVSKGQFMSSIGSSESLRVKFDDEKPVRFSYSSASDGSSDVLFINNSSKFISHLKKAKKLMLEVEFYQEGYKILNFDVEGLDWAR